MQEYHNLVHTVLSNGTYKQNRTGVDTISSFGQSYSVGLSEGFPLMTTKDLSGSRWESLVYEFLWYLSGDADISELKKHTSIWDTWADSNDMLETAYGRFWRRYPQAPEDQQIEGENWSSETTEWVNEDGSVDQLAYAVHMLTENPNSRRIVVTAWHPANATTSLLPPCHFTFVCNVQGDKLNVHLTQRSGDVAVGIPFNIASYALLANVLAVQTEYELGKFHHTIVDAHIYSGEGDRGSWYQSNLSTVQELVSNHKYEEAEQYINRNAPSESKANSDHIPNLLQQLQRTPTELPQLDISDSVTIDTIERSDIELRNYNPDSALQFYVAG